MIRPLLKIRALSLLHMLTAQARKRGKSNKGTYILFGFLYLYVFAMIAGMMGFTFLSLAEPYHALGLDWLYFALAGLMGLGFAVIGSVFTTQSQLYDAKDNALLLSMPISPGLILFSRMIPLLVLNLLFSGIVFIPAIVVYGVTVGFSGIGLAIQLISLGAIALFAQAVSCILGWLLHLLLTMINKSLASVLYLVVFLSVYFYLYSQASSILNSMVADGQAIADSLSWVWPLYALGVSCIGNLPHAPVFPILCLLCFAAVYTVLSATFLKTATMSSVGRKRRKLKLHSQKTFSPGIAISRKELQKFLGTPVYLTNMGIGILMTVATTAVGLFLRNDILSLLTILPNGQLMVPLIICGSLSFLISTMCITAPIISLEGKNIWILKSMPVSTKDILLSKLYFHCCLTVPVCAISGAILALVFGCSTINILLCALLPGLLAVTCGLVGLLSNLQWAKLDYISEAYPCKQAMPVVITMFGMMGIPLALGLLYGFLLPTLPVPAFLCLCTALLAGCNFGLYKLLISRGCQKWEQL